MSIETFEGNYNNIEVERAFTRITKLSVKDNKAAYISFINCLSVDRNFNAIKALNHSLEALKQTKDGR